MNDQTKPTLTVRQKNNHIATGVGIFAVAMTAFAIFVVPPAYRLFCQVTGWGGTPQRVDVEAREVLERTISVRFDANHAPDLPWVFKPEQHSQSMRVGETMLAFYEAENLSTKPVSGQATFNVAPAKAGIYFKKIDCFCFTEQTLQPGEKVSMPVAYYIDPAIDKDPNMDEVETVTLSYTFFRLDDDGYPVIASTKPKAAAQ